MEAHTWQTVAAGAGDLGQGLACFCCLSGEHGDQDASRQSEALREGEGLLIG